jgi:hypothetical protein
MKYQHRYVQYALAHGVKPGAMRDQDRKRWPGGSMCGFILWGRRSAQAFAEENTCRDFASVELKLGCTSAHAVYDEWLLHNRERFTEDFVEPSSELGSTK